MKSIFALYLAQAKTFLRERTAIFIILLLPVTFGVFFGLIFSGDSEFILQLGLVNEDDGAAGAALIENLKSMVLDEGFQIQVGTRQEMLSTLKQGDLHAVLVLPEGLSRSLASGVPVEIMVFYDPGRTTSAGIGMGMVQTLLNEVNLAVSGAPRLLQMRAQSVLVEQSRPIDFYMPGMLGVALLWLGVFGVAQPLVGQREAQILRRLSLTAINRTTILTAEVAWRVSIGLIQAAIFLLVGYLGFQVRVVNWGLFSGAVLLGTLVFVAMGYTLAGLAKSAESAMGISQLVNFPMMMLSGSIIDAGMLPSIFQPVVRIMPLTYLSDLLRQSMAGATPINPPGVDFLVLGGWLAVLLILAVRFWRWE